MGERNLSDIVQSIAWHSINRTANDEVIISLVREAYAALPPMHAHAQCTQGSGVDMINSMTSEQLANWQDNGNCNAGRAPEAADATSYGRQNLTGPAVDAIENAQDSDDAGAVAWQPIETAPKDRDILAVRIEWWEPVNGNHRWIHGNIRQTKWDVERHRFGFDHERQPTHWTEVPAIPPLPIPSTDLKSGGQRS